MLEFRYKSIGRWEADIKRLGLVFVIESAVRKNKEVFLLSVSQWATSKLQTGTSFSNAYKTRERAEIKANAVYKEYQAADEEE